MMMRTAFKVVCAVLLLVGTAGANLRVDSIQDSATPGLCLRSGGTGPRGTGVSWQACLAAGGGAAPGTSKYIVQIPDPAIPNAEALSGLASGVVHNTTTTGILTVSPVNLATEVTGILGLANLPTNATIGLPLLSGASFPAYNKLGLAAILDTGTVGQCVASSGGGGLTFGACGGGGGGVTSFNTRTGAVTSQVGDYSAGQVTNAYNVVAGNTVTTASGQIFNAPVTIHPNGTDGVQVTAGGILQTVGAGTIAATTAVGLAATPTLCGTGNYARGVDINGNALGCTAAGGGGGGGYSTVDEEGVAVTQRSVLNFIGGAITAADDGVSKTNVTLSEFPSNATTLVGTNLTVNGTSPILINGSGSSTLANNLTFSILAAGINATHINQTANYNFTGQLIGELSGPMTCTAAPGKIGTDATTVQFCSNAGTPVLGYLALANSSGVATSASALAANGSNCSAGSAAGGVDAVGAAEACTPYAQLPGGSSVDGELTRWSGTGANTLQTSNYNSLCTASNNPYDCCTGVGAGTCNVKTDTTGTLFALALSTPRKFTAGSCDTFKTQAGTTNTIALCAPATMSASSNTITFTASGNIPAGGVESVGTNAKCARFNSSGILVASDVDCATSATVLTVAGASGSGTVPYGGTITVTGGTAGANLIPVTTAEVSTDTITLLLDTTKIGTSANSSVTFGNGAASYVWTWGLSSGTNPTLTFASGNITTNGSITTTAADGSRQVVFQDNTSDPSVPASGFTSVYTKNGEPYTEAPGRDVRSVAGVIASIISDTNTTNTVTTAQNSFTKALSGNPPTNRIWHVRTAGTITLGTLTHTHDYSIQLGNTTASGAPANSSCTGSGAPTACCTGTGTGTCGNKIICDTGTFTISTTSATKYNAEFDITVRSGGASNAATVQCDGKVVVYDTTPFTKPVDTNTTNVDLLGTDTLTTVSTFGSTVGTDTLSEKTGYIEIVR
jgi:hypothetical protein